MPGVRRERGSGRARRRQTGCRPRPARGSSRRSSPCRAHFGLRGLLRGPDHLGRCSRSAARSPAAGPRRGLGFRKRVRLPAPPRHHRRRLHRRQHPLEADRGRAAAALHALPDAGRLRRRRGPLRRRRRRQHRDPLRRDRGACCASTTRPARTPTGSSRPRFAALFWAATAGALVALPFAEPISDALLDEPAPELARIAIGGLWVLTLFEYLLTLFRLEERARAYFVTTIANVPGDDRPHGRCWWSAPTRARAGCCSAATRPAPPSSSA